MSLKSLCLSIEMFMSLSRVSMVCRLLTMGGRPINARKEPLLLIKISLSHRPRYKHV